LKETNRVAVAEVVIRTTPHLAVVYPEGKALIMNTLRYQDELRDPTGLELPPESLKSAGVSPKEVDLAKRLVDDMTEHWDPSKYTNTYHHDLMARIKEKIKKGQTEEITEPSKEERTPRSAQVIDLADLLKKSLGKGGGARKSAREEATERKPAKRAAAKRVAAHSEKTSARRKRA
jgi:DNA end-binding protein Ku